MMPVTVRVPISLLEVDIDLVPQPEGVTTELQDIQGAILKQMLGVINSPADYELVNG